MLTQTAVELWAGGNKVTSLTFGATPLVGDRIGVIEGKTWVVAARGFVVKPYGPAELILQVKEI